MGSEDNPASDAPPSPPEQPPTVEDRPGGAADAQPVTVWTREERNLREQLERFYGIAQEQRGDGQPRPAPLGR